MIDTVLVTVAILAGAAALAGVPLRCWQFATGRFRPHIPRHALAQASFNLFRVLFLVPNALGCAYALLEGFLLTARRRDSGQAPS